MTGGVVVCLGETGRNFAAGMSGGIAYVLDEDGEFQKRCNIQMVSLEQVDVDHEKELMTNMLEADESRLKHYIQSHYSLTGSEIAKTMLDDWDSWRPRFFRVMPHEYKRALESMVTGKISGGASSIEDEEMVKEVING
jgi:glutamate synthase (NADPH/NADH) large chain